MPVPGSGYRVSSLTQDTRFRVASLLVAATILLLAATFAIRLFAKPFLTDRNILEAFSTLHAEAPPSPVVNHPSPALELNIDGVPVVVPPHRLTIIGSGQDHNPIQVFPDPGPRTPQGPAVDGVAHAFTLLMPWQDKTLRDPATAEIDRHGHAGPVARPWLMIGLAPYDDLEATGRNPGFGPVLRERIKRPAGRLPTTGAPGNPGNARVEIEEPTVHYAMRGTDPATGLEWAEPVGPATERMPPWNSALYWQSNDALDPTARRVTDLIECYQVTNPDRQQNCTHDFYLPEWGARLAVTYPRARLPQWQEIKTRVRELILSFEAKPALPRNTPKATTASETDCRDGKGVQEMPTRACAGGGRHPKEFCCHG